MNWFRSKRGIVVGGVALLLALFLVRPGANQLRTQIVRSISLALGRPVEVAYVRIRLLPRPGFDLENFVVHDDPAFGAEPMLRADDVTASLRLRSLLRGHLEIARLNLTEPSLNLVRNAEGHWNLERLLERSAQIQVAPTGKPGSEKRQGFPYIEASRGRINFKFGAEKKPYTLTDADFSLWQDSENTWGTRLQAQPVRTDFNLTDTGVIHVSGSWQRASSLRDTPLQFTAVWERAQLGQLTKLAYGSDKGWRGPLKIAASLSGTPADLAVKMDASADDFHRYNILGNGRLRLAAQCSGHYSSLDRAFTNISCHAPGPEGAISLAGTVGSPFESRTYDVAVTVQGMSVHSLVDFARHVTRGLPDDLATSGQVDAKLRFQRAVDGNFRTVLWTGGGEVSDLHLVSRLTNGDVELHSVPFTLVSSNASQSQTRSSIAGKSDDPPSEPHVEIGPFRVALGRPTPALVRGWVARSGYNFELQGEAQVQRFLQVARIVGIPALPSKAEGSAKLDLQLAGDWSEQTAPRAMGRAQLHSIRAQVRNWNAPLEITSADVSLLPDEIDVKNFMASVAGAFWHGSLTIPRPCGIAAACPIQFELHADEIALDRLNQLLNLTVPKQPWYRFLSPSETSGTPYLLTANATGKLTANRIVLRALTATQFSAKVDVKSGRLQLSEMRADVLGGRHTGEWRADFASTPPQYWGSGTLERVSLRQLSATMHDGWVTGSANATYRASASGLNEVELYSTASGTLQVKAWEGVLPHIMLPEGTSPLQVRRLAARLLLKNQEIDIKDGQLETPDATYQLSGTASLGRALNLKLTREGAPGFAITGTLAEPRVSEVTTQETQAALKP